MKLTNEDALKLYEVSTKELPRITPQNVKINKAVDVFVEKYVGNDQDVDLHIYHMMFKNLISRKPRHPTMSWNESIFHETINLGGRPISCLGDGPSPKKSRTILSDAVRFIENFACNQNVSKEEALDMISAECERVWKKKSTKPEAALPLIDATALIYNVNLSCNQYQMLRSICYPHGLIFPTRNTIDSMKTTLHPQILSCELKASVDFEMLLADTAKSLISLHFQNTPHDQDDICLTGKFGVDGSGSHKIRQQLINIEKANDETPHLNPEQLNTIILNCYVPLSLTAGTHTVWENPLPNSTIYARPVSITRAKEERTVLEKELVPIFDVIKRSPCIPVGNLHVTCKTECSMMDGKMVGIVQGDTGAFCHLCTASRTDCNDDLHILNGFDIDRDYQTCMQSWQDMLNSDVKLQSSERKGQCHEPIIQSNLFCCSILHYKLRSLDFVQKILYHLVAGQKLWPEKKGDKDLASAKQKCIDHIRLSTGLLIDTPTGIAGNTNSGPMADRFFSCSARDDICSVIEDEEDRANFKILLSKLNILTHITQRNAKEIIDCSQVKALGIDIMHHIKTCFLDEKGNSWVMITPSIHQLCAHTWQLFDMNGGKSIGRWSENPLESWNKSIRSFQSGPAARARQNSMKNNLHDILKRMLIRSHPSIAAKYPRSTCSICGEIGHTARSSRHKLSSVPSQEDAIIASFYINDVHNTP